MLKDSKVGRQILGRGGAGGGVGRKDEGNSGRGGGEKGRGGLDLTDKGVKRHSPEAGVGNWGRECEGGELFGVEKHNSDRGSEDCGRGGEVGGGLGGCLVKESE